MHRIIASTRAPASPYSARRRCIARRSPSCRSCGARSRRSGCLSELVSPRMGGVAGDQDACLYPHRPRRLGGGRAGFPARVLRCVLVVGLLPALPVLRAAGRRVEAARTRQRARARSIRWQRSRMPPGGPRQACRRRLELRAEARRSGYARRSASMAMAATSPARTLDGCVPSPISSLLKHAPMGVTGATRPCASTRRRARCFSTTACPGSRPGSSSMWPNAARAWRVRRCPPACLRSLAEGAGGLASGRRSRGATRTHRQRLSPARRSRAGCRRGRRGPPVPMVGPRSTPTSSRRSRAGGHLHDGLLWRDRRSCRRIDRAVADQVTRAAARWRFALHAFWRPWRTHCGIGDERDELECSAGCRRPGSPGRCVVLPAPAVDAADFIDQAVSHSRAVPRWCPRSLPELGPLDEFMAGGGQDPGGEWERTAQRLLRMRPCIASTPARATQPCLGRTEFAWIKAVRR